MAAEKLRVRRHLGVAKDAAYSASAFVAKWGPGGTASRLNERAGAQSHFLDLCRLLEVPTPDDPDSYCFEKGFRGTISRRGFADIWKRACFAWEYKAPGGDLGAALQQLIHYALPLENPPLLVVSDRLTIEIHTHFTGHPSTVTSIALQDLLDPVPRDLLRSVFIDPYRFKPAKTVQQLTAEAASTVAAIADQLRGRGVSARMAAHFLTQCVFCFFADDADLLPSDIFKRLVKKRIKPNNLQKMLIDLFEKMQDGGNFGVDDIPWFNGGLFKQIEVPELTESEIATLSRAASNDWRFIDAGIFGTLFERGLDPSKRAQLGAHYTDTDTIMKIVDAAIRRPLQTEWSKILTEISGLLSNRDVRRARAKGIPSSTSALKTRYARIRTRANEDERKAQSLFSGFLQRLNAFRVLDPACGSGNFLYIALKCLKDIEYLANVEAEQAGLQRQLPVTGPHNVLGIEINEYASELARVTVWIGELQWLREHGYQINEHPVLQPLDHIQTEDALITAEGNTTLWPDADAVVGNPPFIGNKKMRSELGSAYVEALRKTYEGRVPGAADLVCYWFEKAREQIEAGRLQVAGLVATNSIRGGANRKILERIIETTNIFMAWSDEPWVNDGAAVRVSMIGFGKQLGTVLDGKNVATIHADLTAENEVDLTKANRLTENAQVAFMGVTKVGPFDIQGKVARSWLSLPNPNNSNNCEVLRPSWNGLDVTRRNRDIWIIDFGCDMDESTVSLFEAPFSYARKHILPMRKANNREAYRKFWWRHGESRPGLRKLIMPLPRYIATPEVAKHRVFVWVPSQVLPDKNLQVITRSDDTTFGILHSRFHGLWSLCMGTSLEDRPRYTPTTTFETFPFPFGLTPEDTAHQQTEALPDGALIPANLPAGIRPHAATIACAAKRLDELRKAWLNPPEWTRRIPEVVPMGMKTSPYPDRIEARLGCETELARRTLTNLYNERPAWLDTAHKNLDEAVATAYGWTDYTPAMPDKEILSRLLTLNLGQSKNSAQ
ncbi:class I SAM-dependent DNA methyltransferase [Burkholderia ubonensis]|uniref:class I SAM-dependent DNA methyltransferase n=1 Tax=Burkholderia ubonensis TaxID=101571 RepID=UPI000AE5C7B1|nr:DNA methyltransferase [Burkholderia ubonensis]